MSVEPVRVFELHRDVDESGVSGVGIVAQGIEFRDGTVAMRWLTEFKSTALYDSMVTVEKVHGHGGRTRIVFTYVREGNTASGKGT